MDQEINTDIIEKTTKCPRDFQCLNDHGRPNCKIENVYVGEVLFVTCSSNLNCFYNLTHGVGNMCLCPTIAELYGKNRI